MTIEHARTARREKARRNGGYTKLGPRIDPEQQYQAAMLAEPEDAEVLRQRYIAAHPRAARRAA